MFFANFIALPLCVFADFPFLAPYPTDSISYPFELPEELRKIPPAFVITFQSCLCGSSQCELLGAEPNHGQLSVPSTVLYKAGVRAVLEVTQPVPVTSSGCPSRSGSLSSFVFGVSAPTSVDRAWWPVAHFISLVSALRAVSQARDFTERKGGWGWHSGDQLPAFLRKFPIS